MSCVCAADSPGRSLGWTGDWGPCGQRAEALGEDGEGALCRVERAGWGHGSGSGGRKVGSRREEVSLTPDLRTTFSRYLQGAAFTGGEEITPPQSSSGSRRVQRKECQVTPSLLHEEGMPRSWEGGKTHEITR